MRLVLPKLKRWQDNWQVREITWQGTEYKINVLDLPYSAEFGFDFKSFR
jgi:hypothetical protein